MVLHDHPDPCGNFGVAGRRGQDKIPCSYQGGQVFPVAQIVKTCLQCRRLGNNTSVAKWGVNPLQYSCLENPMDRGAWRATVHGVAKSQA